VPAALLLILLQCVISLTGNYCYFNLLSICLCLLLFDDGVWPRRLRGWLGPPEGPPAAEREPAPRRLFRPWPWWFLGPVAAFLLPLSALALASSYEGTARRPQFLAKVYEAVAPFRSINSYGLFRNMTTSRPEIVVEGSDDGKVWKAYEFRHKPGDLARQPRFVAPHQPRLDWQMWFAALGSRSERYWFAMFCLRLLEGSPPVLSLLAENPFPAAPPRQVRAMLYDYRFTTPAERRATGNWWKRESLVVFQRPATLEMMQALFKR
jgi:hypothetical protein